MKAPAFILLLAFVVPPSAWSEGRSEEEHTYRLVDANGKATGAVGHYRGEMIDGKRDGRGIYKVENSGSDYTYAGEWKSDQRHGQGVFSTPGGYTYQGGFANNLKSGFGREQDKRGYSYEGQFANNARNGMGIYHYGDSGQTIEGNWVDSKAEGFFIVTGADGTMQAAWYERGKLLAKSVNLARMSQASEGCNGKYAGWILVSGECTRQGLVRNSSWPQLVNRETFDVLLYEPENRNGQLEMFRLGLIVHGEMRKPFEFTKAQVMRLRLGDDGKSTVRDIVYAGPMKGLAPHGAGQCANDDGKLESCTMEIGVRVK